MHAMGLPNPLSEKEQYAVHQCTLYIKFDLLSRQRRHQLRILKIQQEDVQEEFEDV